LPGLLWAGWHLLPGLRLFLDPRRDRGVFSDKKHESKWYLDPNMACRHCADMADTVPSVISVLSVAKNLKRGCCPHRDLSTLYGKCAVAKNL